MAEEYTLEEFNKLLGKIATKKVNKLCTNVVKAVGKAFVKEAVKETPKHKGSYTFPEKWKGHGYSKSSTGLKQGWRDNKNLKVSKGSRVYTAVVTNKAKSSYKSGYSGKRRTDYYAHYVDEGFVMKGGYKPFLDKKLRTSSFKGYKFTDKVIKSTYTRVDEATDKVISKWLDEVF